MAESEIRYLDDNRDKTARHTHIPELQREASKNKTPSKSMDSLNRVLAWENMIAICLATEMVSVTATTGALEHCKSSPKLLPSSVTSADCFFSVSKPLDDRERAATGGSYDTEVISVKSLEFGSECRGDGSSVTLVEIDMWPMP
jgi:hypothetical protein